MIRAKYMNTNYLPFFNTVVTDACSTSDIFLTKVKG